MYSIASVLLLKVWYLKPNEKVREIVGFNNSMSEVMGQVELLIRLGEWKRKCTFLLVPKSKMVSYELYFSFKLNLSIDVVGYRLTNNNGNFVPRHLVFIPQSKK